MLRAIEDYLPAALALSLQEQQTLWLPSDAFDLQWNTVVGCNRLAKKDKEKDFHTYHTLSDDLSHLLMVYGVVRYIPSTASRKNMTVSHSTPRRKIALSITRTHTRAHTQHAHTHTHTHTHTHRERETYMYYRYRAARAFVANLPTAIVEENEERKLERVNGRKEATRLLREAAGIFQATPPQENTDALRPLDTRGYTSLLSLL
jgi:hypothetical protein